VPHCRPALSLHGDHAIGATGGCVVVVVVVVVVVCGCCGR
jgi:hypothetical protein